VKVQQRPFVEHDYIRLGAWHGLTHRNPRRYLTHKCAYLAAAVLALAARDWRQCGACIDWPKNVRRNPDEWGTLVKDFKSPRAELKEFFSGAWFEYLAWALDVAPVLIRRELGVR